MYYGPFFLVVNSICWHSGLGINQSSRNKTQSMDCRIQLSSAPWGKSSWGKYAAYDDDYNKVEPKLMQQNRSSQNSTTTTKWLYTLPRNTTLIGKCHNTYMNIDDTSTFSSTCKSDGQWEPSLSLLCQNCINGKCNITCNVPLSTKGLEFEIYHGNGTLFNRYYENEAPIKSKLQSKCEEGYLRADGMNDPFTSTCLGRSDGTRWIPEIPKCFKICDAEPALQNILLDPCFFRSEQLNNCNRTLVAGTSAIALCKDGYYTEAYRESMYAYCDEFGTWTNLPDCVEECGKIFLRGKDSYGGIPAIFGKYAWHIAIYRLDTTPLLICGGTIVSSRLVISAAHCFFDEPSGKQLDRKNYEIFVSKRTRDYKEKDNEYTEGYKVKEIIFSKKEYNPNLSGNYGSDIVILVTEKPITYVEEYVYPACLAWSNSQPYELIDGQVGEVYGWGYNEFGRLSQDLTFVKIPYINYNDCIRKVLSKHVTQDKFCAGSEEGPGPRIGDSGGGFLVRMHNRYYLRGVVSDRDNIDSTSNKSINSFTDLSYYVSWIRDVKERLNTNSEVKKITSGLSGNMKVIPQIPIKEKGSGSDPVIPSEVAQDNSTMICKEKNEGIVYWRCEKTELCQHSQQLLASKQQTSCGRDGSNLKICCPYRFDSVKIAQEWCAEYSQYTYVNQTTSGKFLEIKPGCIDNSEGAIISNEEGDVREQEFPHMALIGRKSKTEMKIQWFCDGSLISSQYILSPAHCNDNYNFVPSWVLLGEKKGISRRPNEEMNKNGQVGLFRIVQRINHPQYKRSELEYDIALFQIERPVQFSTLIRPACLVLPAGLKPSLAMRTFFETEWDKTNNDEQEHEFLLKKAPMDVLTDNDCVKIFKQQIRKFDVNGDLKTRICASPLKYRSKGYSRVDYTISGPLQSRINDPDYKCMWFQEGINLLSLSYGGEFPIIRSYTRVSRFLSWIQPIVWPAQW